MLTGASPTKSKYHNQKIEYNGETFDSKKEYEYFLILKDREKRGEIIDLKRQYPIEIQPAFEMPNGKKIRAITYIADFVYYEVLPDSYRSMIYPRHVVDVKGMKTDVYKLKKKLLAYRGIFIEEV